MSAPKIVTELIGAFDMNCPGCGRIVRWTGAFLKWPVCPHCGTRPAPEWLQCEEQKLLECVNAPDPEDDPKLRARLQRLRERYPGCI